MKKYVAPSIEIEELLTNDIMVESEGFNFWGHIVDKILPPGEGEDGPTLEDDINRYL